MAKIWSGHKRLDGDRVLSLAQQDAPGASDILAVPRSYPGTPCSKPPAWCTTGQSPSRPRITDAPDFQEDACPTARRREPGCAMQQATARRGVGQMSCRLYGSCRDRHQESECPFGGSITNLLFAAILKSPWSASFQSSPVIWLIPFRKPGGLWGLFLRALSI